MFEHDNEADDTLDKFFRKKVQEYSINYREEDWQKLKERLDLLLLDHERNN